MSEDSTCLPPESVSPAYPLQPEYPYDDPSHSGVYDYPTIDHEKAMIGDLLSDVVESLHKAEDFK
jgi:hypothetical protein